MTKRFLIADDDKTNRKVLTALLSTYGECESALDGEDTVKRYLASLAVNRTYAALFLDMHMPKKSGVQVLSEIRGIERKKGISGDDQTKVIMLTGDSGASTINEATALGISYYILKPVDGKKLIHELERLGIIGDNLEFNT